MKFYQLKCAFSMTCIYFKVNAESFMMHLKKVFLLPTQPSRPGYECARSHVGIISGGCPGLRRRERWPFKVPQPHALRVCLARLLWPHLTALQKNRCSSPTQTCQMRTCILIKATRWFLLRLTSEKHNLQSTTASRVLLKDII